MNYLIAVSGLSGSGKTTAIDYFIKVYGGHKVYLGDYVINEVTTRGLPQTRENERQVRMELRKMHGLGVFAKLALDDIRSQLSKKNNVFVDAIFSIQELAEIEKGSTSNGVQLLAINSTFHTRCDRLRKREDRPLTADDLTKRDTTEINELGIESVLASANHSICNEGTLEELYSALREFWTVCTD